MKISYSHMCLSVLQCQDTLVQFGTFLASNLSIDDYMHRLPPMKELLTLYHVNSDLAFFLARPMFNHQISLKCDELRKGNDDWKNKSDGEKQDVYVKATQQVSSFFKSRHFYFGFVAKFDRRVSANR